MLTRLGTWGRYKHLTPLPCGYTLYFLTHKGNDRDYRQSTQSRDDPALVAGNQPNIELVHRQKEDNFRD